jgi:glutamyl-tRNA synthetase
MAESAADRARLEGEGRRGVVRLKMPREGNCEFRDHIRGDMVVEWAREQDHVIQRADGSVLYNLANVVDDYDMQITHVIRAEEHLSNTARQIFIARGLGYELPEYAHVPFVAEPGSKNKLSKRKIANYLKNPDFKRIYEHGKTIADRLGLATAAETFNPVIVDFYERVGYLPDAVLNYLVLLGWSLDDKTEYFTRQQMIELFSLERVNRAPASLDVKKLFAFQDRYFQTLAIGERVDRALPFLRSAGLVSEPMTGAAREMVTRIVTEAGPRLVVAGDVLEYAHFFQPDDQLAFDEKAFEKLVQKPPGPAQLARLRAIVAADEPLTAASLKQKVEDFARTENVKPGPLSQTLRVAVTGKDVGFGTYETVAILGQQRALARIDRALARIKSES